MIVFSTQWFTKYQSLIVRVARLPIFGELIFGFKKMGHYVDREKIFAVRPNSVVEFVSIKGKEITLKNHYFERNEYALRLQKVFYPIWITFHVWDILTKPWPQLNLGFDTLTVYSAGNGVSPTSGNLYRINQSTWSDAHSTTTAGSVNATSTPSQLAKTEKNEFGYRVFRGVTMFDTSDLTSGATISDAKPALYVTLVNDTDNDGDDWINVVQASCASTTTLATGDFDAIGDAVNNPTEGATRIDLGDIGTDAYKEWTLTATGIGWISKTGITQIGWREGHDCINSAIADNTADGITANIGQSSSNKPKLVVTYTLVSASVNIPTLSLMGVG